MHKHSYKNTEKLLNVERVLNSDFIARVPLIVRIEHYSLKISLN